MKSSAILLLRSLGLLKLADTGLYGLRRVRSVASNRRFRRAHPGFATPPPHIAFDALNHVQWTTYLETGRAHAAMFARILDVEVEGQQLDVLEWGSGPGRIIRHLRDASGGRIARLTGADYNEESVAWCRANLPDVEFVQNGLMPPLELESDRFDVVYCFSVFTHLSEEAQLAWAAELRRVLKPGGLLLCTTHGDNHRFLLADEGDLAKYDAGEPVVAGRYREGRKWFLGFHPPRYVRERLLGEFEGVQAVDVDEGLDMLTQQVWAARKPFS